MRTSGAILIWGLIIFIVLSFKAGEDVSQPKTQRDIVVVQNTQVKEIGIDFCSGYMGENKTYMGVERITNQTSPQWEYLTSLDCIYVYTDAYGKERLAVKEGYNGFIVDNTKEYIGVAMGSYFGKIGTKYNITLYDEVSKIEKIIKVVKVEEKANRDTCQYQICGGANDVIEFVIDENHSFMKKNIGENGLIFNGNFNNCDFFNGNVVKIEKVEVGVNE